ncbi:S-adenosylmethionine synthetase [Cenarchaeum symbiosum A]|uniref:Methionine adenosyltransferase n=1 Tax=Cenarchaeum symbiosum (strain A) TaxID=414004 RepID=A0RYZ1_CENSY|nr:S-adenosylmethionine synthetase [Cenarchaeum symbiosum A]
MKRRHLFTSESVTEGHPDKLCDQISDAFLDEYITQDPDSRVAVETLVTTDFVAVAGEVTSKAQFDAKAQEALVRRVVSEVGYDDPALEFDAKSCEIDLRIHAQSPDISRGVTASGNGAQGAGDQGLMFGYATDETKELMPLPILLAHRLTKKLTEERRSGGLPWARPDGKSQVSIVYEGGKPKRIDAVVISTQHAPDVANEEIRKSVISRVIKPVCGEYWDEDIRIYVNPTGRFEIGGPHGDAGLTGRKIIVDTYGGYGRHGGGAFSGKDPSKVDRSACYMCRYVAKNIVAAGLAEKCEVQVAYAIGVAEPVSLMVSTFDTHKADEDRIESAVREVFDMTPSAIISHLGLKSPIYRKTSAYGHFGRDEPEFSWERTDKADSLRKAAGL